MLRKCLTIIALVTFLTASPAAASWNHPLSYGLYVRLAQCETGNRTDHLTRSYVGAFGFAKPTWRMFADTSPTWAHRLTFAQQARVLDRAFWFGYGKQFAVGPWGHGCFRRLWRTDANLRTEVCNNRKHEVRRWCRP